MCNIYFKKGIQTCVEQKTKISTPNSSKKNSLILIWIKTCKDKSSNVAVLIINNVSAKKNIKFRRHFCCKRKA